MRLPLEGIRVLDFSEGIFAPFCAMMLGDMGADVIKIERVQGEMTRYGLRLGGGGGMDEARKESRIQQVDVGRWLCGNRSKRSLAVNIKEEEGREIALRLAKTGDVALHNFRPGVMERLGLSYQDLAKVNPRIIYCSLYGYGETGPMAHRAGGDLWAQGMGGVVSIQGSPNSPPHACGVAVGDEGGAPIAAFGIMVALFVREKMGIGQELTSNLLNVVLHITAGRSSRYLIDGQVVRKTGRCGLPPPMGTYRAKDKDMVTMTGSGPDWPVFCKALGIEHLATDPRFENDEVRWANHEALYEIVDKIFAEKTVNEWQQIFREHRLRIDPCLDFCELFDGPHPQVAANEMLVTMEHPVRGPMRMVGIPVKLKATPGKPQCPPPLLGQHTEELLIESGYTPEQIDRLEEAGIINTGGFRKAKAT